MQREKVRPTAIFDFDGTIVDSKAGILSCLRQTLRRRNLSWQEPLDWFVGPPAKVSMPQLLPGMSSDEHSEIVAEYRTLYGIFGWSDAAVYPGVREMLEVLQRHGWRMFVCTAKRRDFTLKMLSHFRLDHFFEAIYSDSIEAPSSSKSALLQQLLKEHRPGIGAVMIGDRVFDIEAGRACGLRTLAVSYGYGSSSELNAAAPDAVLASPAAVLEALGIDSATGTPLQFGLSSIANNL